MEIRKCQCINIEFGSHDNQITLKIPTHMKKYKKQRIISGLNDEICIDACILHEMRKLWSNGIITYGSCCGHNKQQSFVNVDEKHIPLMLELGYVQNHSDSNRKDTFRLKTGC